MKKIISFVITAVIFLTATCSAFAAGNNIILSSDSATADFNIYAEELDKNYYDSSIKYYTVSVPGMSVRIDKNALYDHDLDAIRFVVKPGYFAVGFFYEDGSRKKPDTLALDMRYTLTGKNITPYSVAVFGDETVTCDSTADKKIVFTTKNLGEFSVEKYEFTDVNDPSMWYYKYINSCAALGVLSGMGDGTFMPGSTVTRGQLAVMIVNSTKNVIDYRVDPSLEFKDVEQGKWYYEAIMKCATMGFVFGKTETEYAPNDLATREQIAAVVARVINKAGMYGGKTLPDVSNTSALKKLYPDHASISNYAKGNVLLCNKLDIMVGDDRGFRPQANTTRAECAVIFYSLKNSLA